VATQGICTFSGVLATKGWDFTFGPGVEPSTCVILTLENLSLEIGRTGDLVIGQYSDSEQDYWITFPDCRISHRVLTSGRSGTFVKLAIQDRRWKWQFSQIDGSYNVRKSESNIIRKKTPQELATLLFRALGEVESTGEDLFEVADLPNGPDVWPAADWQGVAAAPLLSQLCSSLGCMVVLDASDNKAKIVKIGEGVALPPGGRVIRKSSPTVIRAVPDEVRFVTGPARFQASFILEPVGIDTDGSIKPIYELSYMPSFGWHLVDPSGFFSVTGTYAKDGETFERRDLAKATVWKMYRVRRIKSDVTDGVLDWDLLILNPTPYKTTKLSDFLPFGQTKLTTFIDKDGEEKEELYSVQGSYALPEQQAVFTGLDNVEGKPVPNAWHRLDGKTGIVYFNQQMFFWGTGNLVNPAALTFTTSFAVNKDGVIVRHEEFRPMVAPGEELGTGPFLLRRGDTVRKVIEVDHAIVSDNKDDIKLEADYYIDQWKRTLESNTAQSRTYSRVVQWSIDGLNTQITWSGGAGRPATTQISQNAEHNPYVPSYKKQVEEIEVDRVSKKAAEFMEFFNPEVFK